MENTQKTDGSTVNDQVTDSVSQANAMVVGAASSEAMSLLDLVSAETIGMSMHNAVTAQQNAQMSTNASITASCARMLQAHPLPEPPVPPKPPEPPVVPPPFMPLDPTIETVSSDLLTEAKNMIEQAESLLKKSDSSGNPDQSEAEAKMLLEDAKAMIQVATSGNESGDKAEDDPQGADEVKSEGTDIESKPQRT